MSAWELPTTLTVGGQSWNIRSDYRAILDILGFFNNPEYENDEKQLICLDILYVDFCKMPASLHQEAAKAAKWFIDAGMNDDGKPHPRLMDWEKDAPLIASSINCFHSQDVRSIPYLHWWTFLADYMNIGDGLFAQVLNIRSKLQKGTRLEKWEFEFYRNNKSMVDLETSIDDESEEIFWDELLKRCESES